MQQGRAVAAPPLAGQAIPRGLDPYQERFYRAAILPLHATEVAGLDEGGAARVRVHGVRLGDGSVRFVTNGLGRAATPGASQGIRCELVAEASSGAPAIARALAQLARTIACAPWRAVELDHAGAALDARHFVTEDAGAVTLDDGSTIALLGVYPLVPVEYVQARGMGVRTFLAEPEFQKPKRERWSQLAAPRALPSPSPSPSPPSPSPLSPGARSGSRGSRR